MNFKLKLVFASALLAVGLAASAQTIIKFSHVVAVDTPKGSARTSQDQAKRCLERHLLVCI